MDIVLIALGLFTLCVLAYSFISLPFMPPSPSSSLAAVPAIPRVKIEDSNSTHLPETEEDDSLPNSPASPGSSVDVSQPSHEPMEVKTLIQEFHSRHKNLADLTSKYPYDGLRKGLFEISCMVLSGKESRDTLLNLLNHPDKQVRITAIEALWDARLHLEGDGFKALDELLTQLDQPQSDAVVAACAEALIQATQEGDEITAHWILASG